MEDGQPNTPVDPGDFTDRPIDFDSMLLARLINQRLSEETTYYFDHELSVVRKQIDSIKNTMQFDRIMLQTLHRQLTTARAEITHLRKRNASLQSRNEELRISLAQRTINEKYDSQPQIISPDVIVDETAPVKKLQRTKRMALDQNSIAELSRAMESAEGTSDVSPAPEPAPWKNPALSGRFTVRTAARKQVEKARNNPTTTY